jgi:hypothetical protein
LETDPIGDKDFVLGYVVRDHEGTDLKGGCPISVRDGSRIIGGTGDRFVAWMSELITAAG